MIRPVKFLLDSIAKRSHVYSSSSRTWRKLSDEGKDAAKGLDMPSPLGDIIADAVGESAS